MPDTMTITVRTNANDILTLAGITVVASALHHWWRWPAVMVWLGVWCFAWAGTKSLKMTSDKREAPRVTQAELDAEWEAFQQHGATARENAMRMARFAEARVRSGRAGATTGD